MTVVVDASVVVAGLASADATGEWAESVLAGEPLAAPHLMPVEVASILHRAERAGEISADAASLAHADLRRLRVEYFPYDPFAERIWELRGSGLAAPPGAPEPVGLVLPRGAVGAGTGDPAENFDHWYERQVETLERESGRLDSQARAALRQVREDQARAALQRKAAVQDQLNDLREQYTMLRRVRHGVADCDISVKRVERQMTDLAESSGEDAVAAELGELRAQQQSLRQQADRLTEASQRLQAKMIDARQRRQEADERDGERVGERGSDPGLSSYAAWYVAVAEFLGAKVATLDTQLALAPGPRCGFCLPPLPPA
jgi:predicted nucleic acid-binding protein